jgi:adenine-specific DNA methylase/very-short-patch-repair endonuclease
MTLKTPKKLIEVALPLDAINVAAAREKSIRHGHPSTLHLWWARRPLAAARAVIFAQMVNDPGYERHLGRGMNKEKAALERERLFKIIEDLVQWENTNNEEVLSRAREEIRKSWRETCELNKNHPQAAELFNPDTLPAFHDPFAGGGALPLEAQRLGLESYASDLNPVAVTINKAMIEIPPKFAGRAPVGPTEFLPTPTGKAAKGNGGLFAQDWSGAKGLAEDVRRYGAWMRAEAEKRIGHLYPKIEITPEMALEREDLKPLVGQKLTVIAWLWARTVASPNPAFSHAQVPLASTFVLSSKAGKEAYVAPVVDGDSYRFTVKVGTPPESAKNGTKLARGANFHCLLSDTPIEPKHIKAEGMAGRMGARLMAIVAEGVRGRVYLSPTGEQETVAQKVKPDWRPETAIPPDKRSMFTPLYGLSKFGDLFTSRQLVALTTFSDLVQEAIEKCRQDSLRAFSPSPFMERGLGGEVPPPITGHAFVSAEKLNFAKQMRQLPTEAEENVWALLRNRRCNGLKFRRQQVILGFIVDFYCAEQRLAIELDGEIHETQRDYDHARDALLAQAHIRVVRLRNEDATEERLRAITSPPNPLSMNGEGEPNPKTDDDLPLDAGGTGALAYAQAVGVYLGLIASKATMFINSLSRWRSGEGKTAPAFGRQAIAMVWDFADVNPFAGAGGDFQGIVDGGAKALAAFAPLNSGHVQQQDAQTQRHSTNKLVSTDPPYYDNIGYADLSDFFYVWLRKSLKPIFPGLYATLAVPKSEELVATPYRHGGNDEAEAFFLEGMTRAIHNLAEQAHPAFPVTIYYAFKQTETTRTTPLSIHGEGPGVRSETTSTGWETFLEAVLSAGFALTGTWPVRTEGAGRMIASGTNALASSIVLVCRKREADATTISRREFLRELNAVLPEALMDMTRGGVNSPVAPVDLSQAIIGPGMAIFSQYAAVLEADGTPMNVRTALQLINRFLAEDDFDHDTQFCMQWFEGQGWATGKYGEADVLARAKGTSVAGLIQAGVVASGKGDLRLLKWSEYPREWPPETDSRTPVWEALHHLIRALNHEGESAAGALLARMPARAEPIRALAYRLYTLCERKSWAEDARAYNELITAWTGVERGASEAGHVWEQSSMDFEGRS